MVFPEVLEGRPCQHPVVMDVPDLHPIFYDTTLADMLEGPCHSQARAESKAPRSAFADGSGDLAVVFLWRLTGIEQFCLNVFSLSSLPLATSLPERLHLQFIPFLC